VFHGFFTPAKYTLTAEDLESGMAPVGEHSDQVFCNPPFGQKHLEDLVPEDRLQLFQLQGRSHSEHTPPVKTSVRHKDMAVGIKPKEIAKALDGDDGTGDRISLRHHLPKEELLGIPEAAAQIGEKIPLKKIIPEEQSLP
jgi:hypothetical protein